MTNCYLIYRFLVLLGIHCKFISSSSVRRYQSHQFTFTSVTNKYSKSRAPLVCVHPLKPREQTLQKIFLLKARNSTDFL